MLQWAVVITDVTRLKYTWTIEIGKSDIAALCVHFYFGRVTISQWWMVQLA